ncbi:YcxB family protein [Croceicoccus ponticola]|uniref:YcxB family protein n=1 Tax=Croceicoccus ponticola TaxID=2217664 RepID=A0A437H1M3_9SPHN|nr:YcxB family protein [Croceicoccus ponticola]RVQ69446.1 YcxB family protein [Croceicoccus ponticola]
MTELGPFTYRIVEDETVAAARIAFRKQMRRPLTRWLLALIVLVEIALLLFDIFDDGMLNLASTAALLFALPFVYFVLLWLIPRQGRRQYRQSAALRDEYTLTFDDAAMTVAGQRGTMRIPFDDFRELAVSDDLILLYQTEMFYSIFPRRALGDAADMLIARLIAAGVRRI